MNQDVYQDEIDKVMFSFIGKRVTIFVGGDSSEILYGTLLAYDWDRALLDDVESNLKGKLAKTIAFLGAGTYISQLGKKGIWDD